MRLIARLILAGVTLGWFGMSEWQSSNAQNGESKTPRTIFLVGDSTVKNGSDNGSGQLWGWGRFLNDRVDPDKYRVENRALGGRSSRTYRTEGLWDKVLAKVNPGDVILIQFGHNDGGPIDSGRARASLKGVGEETKEARVPGRPVEVVQSYGWYLRRYVAEAKHKGAIPILLSPVPRDIWSSDGKVARASKDYGLWAGEVAVGEDVSFIDLNALVADRYESEGQNKVARDYFTTADHTHTTEAGARLNADCVAEGLQTVKDRAVASAIRLTKVPVN